MAAFDEGATAEEIVQQYPALSLADAYAAISYYLRHRSDVEVDSGAAPPSRLRRSSTD